MAFQQDWRAVRAQAVARPRGFVGRQARATDPVHGLERTVRHAPS